MEYLMRMYWLDIVAVVSFVLAMVIMWRMGKRETVRKVILSLVVKAEKELGSGTGELKYAMVTERIYYVLPWVVRIVFTQREIDGMIEDAVAHLKMYLSDESEGKRNLLGYQMEN